METDKFFQIYFLIILTAAAGVIGIENGTCAFNGRRAQIRRSSFPAGFIFGSATSAYQVEGAAMEGGRAPSTWDTYTHRHPEKIEDGSNGDIAIDSYHRYKEDLKIARDMGFDAYRFSISWSRILPNGRGEANAQGIRFYRDFIGEVLSNGLRPFVTIFHWDTPQRLEDEYGGFLSPSIVDDFRYYAEVCFREFGDLVKHWITINEPSQFCKSGYATGKYAPGRCSRWEQGNCSEGDSGTEPYVVGHHLLLAHAAAVQIYRQKYQGHQLGTIGITLYSDWFVPLTEAEANVKATSRALDFAFGWFMNPLVHGEYPSTMRSLVVARLPEFTREQSELLKGSFDFLGINYYTANYIKEVPASDRPSYTTDARVAMIGERDGIPIGPPAPVKPFHIYPEGLNGLLVYIKRKYNDPVIYVTENGVCEHNNSSLSLEDSLADHVRIQFHSQHLAKLLEAIREGVNVKGYFVWSLFDNFEWDSGFTRRFGLVYVDYRNGLNRHKKKSAAWFEKLLHGDDEIRAAAQ